METVLPLLVISVLGTMVLQVCDRSVQSRGDRTIAGLLFGAFFLRLVFVAMFAWFPETRMFHEDAVGYEHIGSLLSAEWNGEPTPYLVELQLDRNYGYFYLSGALCYVFGGARIAPSAVNAFLGALIVFLVYRVARHTFPTAVARRAAAFTAFFPSMVLWSSLALKDTPVTVLILLSISGCLALKRRFTLGAFFATVVPILCVQPIRFYMVYFLGFAVVAALVFERGVRTLTGIPKQLAVTGGIVVLLTLAGVAGSAQSGTEFFDFKRVSSFRQGMASTANSGFGQDVDTSTPAAALAYMPIGLSYLLFSPFPWQFTSLRASFAAPEMVVWWALIPALWRGLRYSLRERFSETSPLLVFAATLTMAYSLVHGNIGSGFRQRAQIFVLLFIFTALGQELKKQQRLARSRARRRPPSPLPLRPVDPPRTS